MGLLVCSVDRIEVVGVERKQDLALEVNLVGAFLGWVGLVRGVHRECCWIDRRKWGCEVMTGCL